MRATIYSKKHLAERHSLRARSRRSDSRAAVVRGQHASANVAPASSLRAPSLDFAPRARSQSDITLPFRASTALVRRSLADPRGGLSSPVTISAPSAAAVAAAAAAAAAAKSAHRALLRACRETFRGDTKALSASTAEVRARFRERSALAPGSDEALRAVADAREAASFVRTNLVQGVVNARGNVEVRPRLATPDQTAAAPATAAGEAGRALHLRTPEEALRGPGCAGGR